MLGEQDFVIRLRSLLADRTPLGVAEFVTKAIILFEGHPFIRVDDNAIRKLISEDYISVSIDGAVSPLEFLKLNPLDLLTAEDFAREAKLALPQVEQMLADGSVFSIQLNQILIPKPELRRFWRENDMQVIHSLEDLFQMLDNQFRDNAAWWNQFFQDRNKGVPFFLDLPDENLVEYLETGRIQPKRVLELGTGNGRNAIYMVKQGAEVDAVDFSENAIQWGKELAVKHGVQVNFLCQSIFEYDVAEGKYDFIYDAGCFHHILPHRRFSYLKLVTKALKPGGYLGMTCFRHDSNGASGPEFSDWEIYQHKMTGGGMAFSKHQLERIFGDDFMMVDFRQMKEVSQPSSVFGKEFLWVVLFQKVR